MPYSQKMHGTKCTIMIRKNLINCKLIREKESGKTHLRKCMDHPRPATEVCLDCGCKGSMRIHAYYNRTLIEFIDGHPVETSLCICRLICQQCKRPSTHSILPDPIIPYCRHSLFFILRVLTEHAIRLRSIERICEVFEISLRTFYRWQKLYNEHRREWQGLLASMETSLKDSILELIRKDSFCTFAASFIRQTTFSILQSHANLEPYLDEIRIRTPGDTFDVIIGFAYLTDFVYIPARNICFPVRDLLDEDYSRSQLSGALGDEDAEAVAAALRCYVS